jgi:hypothetical protein
VAIWPVVNVLASYVYWFGQFWQRTLPLTIFTAEDVQKRLLSPLAVMYRVTSIPFLTHGCLLLIFLFLLIFH